jgi:hypothetical protein
MADAGTLSAERLGGQMSRVVGLYQMLLRRALEHFFPDARLEPAGDRSFIRVEGPAGRSHYRIDDDPDGLGVALEWFRTPYLVRPGNPIPFRNAERRLIEATARLLDRRFRAMFEPEPILHEELFHYAIEDLIIAEDLGAPDPIRMPAALEVLRVAALSTYENRRVSSGVLLLGTELAPAEPARANLPGAPPYNVRMPALKTLHRLCDGLRTLLIVDRRGEVAWPVDIARWADQVQGDGAVAVPCPRLYADHARATRTGGHVAIVLTPAQEIKVFAGGAWAYAFSDARWRLMDIPSKFDAWCRALGRSEPPDLASRIFRAALNLGEDRKGALFVVLRNPAHSLPQLVAPGDRIIGEIAADDPDDPDNLAPRLAKRVLHHLVRGRDLANLDDTVLEAIAGIDGAVVTDPSGRLLTFGAILRIAPETVLAPRAVEGARTTAALAASFHGPVLKVSEDGFLTMFLGGRRVWEL